MLDTYIFFFKFYCFFVTWVAFVVRTSQLDSPVWFSSVRFCLEKRISCPRAECFLLEQSTVVKSAKEVLVVRCFL